MKLLYTFIFLFWGFFAFACECEVAVDGNLVITDTPPSAGFPLNIMSDTVLVDFLDGIEYNFIFTGPPTSSYTVTCGGTVVLERDNAPDITTFTPCPPLPIELDYVRVQGNVLEWRTLSEINVDYISILKGLDWKEIDQVDARGPNVYRYILKEGGYYMIESVDYDGFRQRSEVVFYNKPEERILVYDLSGRFLGVVQDLESIPPRVLYVTSEGLKMKLQQ